MDEAMGLAAIQSKIIELRGVKVMLDRDLAALYQVTTGRLNEQFKRNQKRFPIEFAFQLTQQEWHNLRSQNAILNKQQGKHTKYLPHVFTEYDALALSSILKTEIAISVNQKIIPLNKKL